MLLSDVDGTIIDMRQVILHCLYSYDAAHRTGFFERLRVEDITVHENQVDQLLEARHVPEERQPEILAWYEQERWKPEVILAAHRPFQGVLDVIRWFQLQPDTVVGLVTGRPDELRSVTLRSLNQLGEPFRVQFSDDLLFMNPGQWEENVLEVKAAGLRHFLDRGFRVFAFIDNEPANLRALAQADSTGEILMLHADTIFESKRVRVPRGTVRGRDYRLEELIPGERVLPARVKLAWHGVNDERNLRQFIASDVAWAELDVRFDPTSARCILRHDSFVETPLSPEEEWVMLDDVLDKLIEHDRSAKLDLKAGEPLLDIVLPKVAEKGFPDHRLWFNGNMERVTERGFRRIVDQHPEAIVQCPIDFLAPLILAAPDAAKETLAMVTEWGINRFSLSWEQSELRRLFEQMDQWGYEVNIYNVPDLEAFLQAVLLLPCSVTSDFNFPQWSYFGTGSGEHGERISYRIEQSRNQAS